MISKRALMITAAIALSATTSASLARKPVNVELFVPKKIVVNNAAASEGDPLNFVVTLSQASTNHVSLFYSTESGSAIGSDNGCVVDPEIGDPDFANSSAFLTFAPGETQKIIKIYTCEDRFKDANDVKSMHLLLEVTSSGYELVNDTASGLIAEDGDYSPGLMLPD